MLFFQDEFEEKTFEVDEYGKFITQLQKDSMLTSCCSPSKKCSCKDYANNGL